MRSLFSFAAVALTALFAVPSSAQNFFQNFESLNAPLDNGTVLFRLPSTSPFTSDSVSTSAGSPNISRLTALFLDPNSRAYSGQNAVRVEWAFASEAPFKWLALTTNDAPVLPNPTIAYVNGYVEFKVFVEGTEDVYLTLGTRETGTTAALGANGGQSGNLEWIGAAGTRGASAAQEPLGKRVTAGQWQTVRFFLPTEPRLPFSAGSNGVLNGAKGTLDHVAITPVNPSAHGPFTLSIDDLLIGRLATISGGVTIDGRADFSVPLRYELVPQDGSDTLTGVVTPTMFGNYSIPNVPPKRYTLYLKTENTLRRRIANVDAFTTNPVLDNVLLRGGDANDDNAVDVNDLILLLQHYNQWEGDPNGSYLAAADFINDGFNDISDLELVIFYYNQLGD
jgi:hypothetical protein